MKSAIHRLTEDLTRITGPLFHETKDYQTILHACCLFFARVIQSTPNKGKEDKVVEEAFQHIKYNLNEFLKIEASIETQKEERAEMVAKGIEGFAELGNTSEPENIIQLPQKGEDKAEVECESPRTNPGLGPDGDSNYNPDGPRAYL